MGMRTIFVVLAVVSLILGHGCSGEDSSRTLSRDAAAIVKKPIPKPAPRLLESQTAADIGKEADAVPAAPVQVAEEKVPSAAVQTGGEGKELPLSKEAQTVDTGRAQMELKLLAATDERTGSYLVQKGETLAAVAGKSDVLGDPLKWPILYRLNAHSLDLPPAGHLPDVPLQEGLKLRTPTAEEAARNKEKRSGSDWVVNVLSGATNAEVVPAVVKLAKTDYPFYVATARVNEKEWMRVRVGFFKTKDEAESEGKKIMQVLGLQDCWVTKPGKNELLEFAGY